MASFAQPVGAGCDSNLGIQRLSRLSWAFRAAGEAGAAGESKERNASWRGGARARVGSLASAIGMPVRAKRFWGGLVMIVTRTAGVSCRRSLRSIPSRALGVT